MKPAILFAALIGALAGAGGVALSHLPASTSTPTLGLPLLAPDHPQSGELTSQSRLNLSDGLRSTGFELQAQAGQLVALNTTGPLRADISVLRDGRLIAREQPCDDCTTEPSVLGANVGFRADHSGSYLIAVTGADARAFGPFELRAQVYPAYDGEPLVPGRTLTDLAMGHLKAYRLTIAQDGLYSISLNTANAGMTPLLQLIGPGKRHERLDIQAEDDGSGQGARLVNYLLAGDYIVHVSSAMNDSAFQGAFTLRIQTDSLPDNLDLQDGARLSLDKTRYAGLVTGKEQNFDLDLAHPTLLTLTLSTQSGFGALQSGPFESVPSNDHPHTQVLRAVLQAGTHTITLPRHAQGGLFTLQLVSEPAPANAGGGTLRPGQTRRVVLPAGVRTELYTLTIEEEGHYVMDMRSEVFDSYLVLRRDGQELYHDDDSGGDYHARLEAFLTPGQYQLLAKSLDSVELPAVYELQLSRP
ncbi:hypothetical protein [Alcaligenes sp. SDU_A2]|uniref:hypothetical protein n=1 Tax=Alcaligenes sp. SDU_A2 TaxID=3136634 RepID=UPI00311E63F0